MLQLRRRSSPSLRHNSGDLPGIFPCQRCQWGSCARRTWESGHMSRPGCNCWLSCRGRRGWRGQRISSIFASTSSIAVSSFSAMKKIVMFTSTITSATACMWPPLQMVWAHLRGLWVPPSSPRRPCYWAGWVATARHSHLCGSRATWTGRNTRQFLWRKSFLSWMQHTAREKLCLANHYVWQQDGASCHIGNIVKTYLKERLGSKEFWSKELWSPNSPNQNPLDLQCLGAHWQKGLCWLPL